MLPADERSAYEARAANALRQIGRFDAAEAMRRRAVADLTPGARQEGWAEFLDRLAPAIARKDDGVEPLDLIPDQEAAFRCVQDGRTSRFVQDYCARPALAEAIARARAAQPNAQ